MTSIELPGTAAETGSVPPGAAPVPDETLRTVALSGLTLTVRFRRRSGDSAQGSAVPRLRQEAVTAGTGSAAGAPPPPALFVHGLGGSSLNWSYLMRELHTAVDGEAIDLPGFGHSPPPDDGDYSVSGHARAVIRYLDSAARGPVHLFGNSLGGAVTTRVAALRPDLVRTLTLVSPALPEIPPQASAVPTALLGVPGVSALFARATRDWPPERRVRGILNLCYGDPRRISDEELAAAAEEYRRRSSLPYFWDVMTRSTRGVLAAYTAVGRRSLWWQAEQVEAPVLLVYGLRDKLVSYRMARRACAAFRDARLTVLPDAGHVAMMEHPQAVARAFQDLLRTGARTPASGRS